MPVLNGVHRSNDFVHLEWTADPGDGGKGPNGRTVVSPDGYKLVLHDTDQSMLFDHNKDPQELSNVYDSREYAAIRARLRQQIEAWQKRTGDRLALPA